MSIKWGLLAWHLRQLRYVTLIALPVAVVYTLGWAEPLQMIDGWAGMFVVVHSGLMMWSLGTIRSGSTAFLYTRGYTRDQLWWHRLLALLIGVLAVWLPAAIVIWGKLRSRFQNDARNPFYPLMDPEETLVPLAWLAGYVALLGMLQFTWVRDAQPCRGRSAAGLLSAGFVIATLSIFNAGQLETSVQCVIAAAAVVIVLVSIITGWRMHRRLEVHR